MIDSVEKLRDDRSKIDQEFLENIVGEFRKSLSETAGAELNSVLETLGQVNEAMVETITAIESGHNKIEESSIKVSENFDQSINRLVEATDQIQDVMIKFNEITDDFDKFVNSFSEVNRLFQSSLEPLRDTSEKISDAGIKIKESIDNTASIVDDIINLGTVLQETSQDLRNSWEDYRQRFEGIDDSAQKIFEQINLGLERYTEQIKNFVLELDKHMAKALGDLGGAIGEFSETIEDLHS